MFIVCAKACRAGDAEYMTMLLESEDFFDNVHESSLETTLASLFNCSLFDFSLSPSPFSRSSSWANKQRNLLVVLPVVVIFGSRRSADRDH